MTDNAISKKHISPFERIRRANDAGNEYWSSREFAQVLGYSDYRNFELVINKARTSCFNSGQRIDDHFVDITEMIEIGKGGRREVRTVLLSRYACYLIVQHADPSKEIVALGQTYFAVQTGNSPYYRELQRHPRGPAGENPDRCLRVPTYPPPLISSKPRYISSSLLTVWAY